MMSKVHFWIVCDAVEFIKVHGDTEQKRALQTFQTAYGEKAAVETIARGKSAVEFLAGFESWQTDKFSDLSLSLIALPRGGKHQVAGLGWHQFTAFNHFINPYPEVGSPWAKVSGYSYATSSMAGFDSVVVQGISKCLKGMVDTENSLVLDRIKPFWEQGEEEWTSNFEQALSHTQFAPWTALAQMYYEHFVLRHNEPLEVRGANRYIVGLQLLGPVVHAVTDACSPQHVRSALGFGHSVWENYVKSRAYDREISVDPNLVRRLLTEKPFEPKLSRSEGPLEGKFDVENFVHKLSVRTADRLMESTSKSWKALWQAEGEFWRRYLTGATMRQDAQFFYNMAVAGTVHALVRSCNDLISQGIIGTDGNLVHPGKMPELELVQKDLPELPIMRSGPDSVPPEEVMPVPYSHARDILGFDPAGDTDVQKLLSEVRAVFRKSSGGKLKDLGLPELLKRLERSVTEQYRQMGQKMGDVFCPLRAVESIPIGSDISAHFGTATFRMPSARECKDPAMFERYIAESDSHAFMAYTLQLTQAVAALRFYGSKFARQEASASRLDYLASVVENYRDKELPVFEQGFTVASVGLARAPGVDPVQVAKSEMVGSVRSFLADVQERISAFFSIVPKAALATVAVAALLLIVVIPRGRGPEHPVLGLSPEAWSTPGLTIMGAKPSDDLTHRKPGAKSLKPRLAVMVYVKGIKGPVDQALIDAAYRAATPTAAMRMRYEVLTPQEIKTAADNRLIGLKSMQETLDDLRKQLSVDEVVVVTISPKAALFDVETTLSNLESGKAIGSVSSKGVASGDLANVVSKSIADLVPGK